MNKIEEIAEEIKQNIFDSIDRLSENPQVLEVVSSHSYLADYYLKKVAKTNPEYVSGIKEALVNFL